MRKAYEPVQLREHSADCYSIRNVRSGAWDTPWAYLGEVVYRDAIGRERKSGGSRWWNVRCNCTHCPALIAVHEGSVLTALPIGKQRRAQPQSGNST